MAPREKRLAMALVLVGAFFAGQRLWRMAFAGGPHRDPVARARAARGEPPAVLALHDERLLPVPGKLLIGRDPFRFGVPPPPPPPPELSAAERAELERALALAEEKRLQLLAEQAAYDAIPKPPAIDITYLGSFGPESRKIAVFSDGTTIHNALVGDVVNDKFIVASIGYESVDLKFVGFPDQPAERLAVSGSL
jgi:hypothetical protein